MRRALVLLIWALSLFLQAQSQVSENWALVEKGTPAASIVIVEKDAAPLLLEKAQEFLQKTVHSWTNQKLSGPPQWVRDRNDLPQGAAIVLATLNSLRSVFPGLENSNAA